MQLIVNDEAAHAIKCKGPTAKQLQKAAISNDEVDIPDSRHIRWMAAYIFYTRGYQFFKEDGTEVKLNLSGLEG